MIPEARRWWPCSLSPDALQAVRRFRDKLERPDTCIRLDVALADDACARLAGRMAVFVEGIVEQDSLPQLCHVINGWGNACLNSEPLLGALAPFLHQLDRRPGIIQCHPEGDFHPWQTFAYAVMAGVDPDARHERLRLSLRELALNSRDLRTGDPHELGHFLFAAAHLLGKTSEHFVFGGKERTLKELWLEAAKAHRSGNFAICRKFHITEGLCAAAQFVEVPQAQRIAQGFLDGQMGVLLVLGALLEELTQTDGETALAADLRRALVVDELFENYTYFAGHLIEIAVFAELDGMEVDPVHWRAACYVVNVLNLILPQLLPRISFRDYFLHVGHYRRAVSALRQHEEGTWTWDDTDRYVCDFDHVDANPDFVSSPLADSTLLREWPVAPPKPGPRPRFQRLLEAFEASSPELVVRGHLPHFRRIAPPSWPRAIHYEFLDYGAAQGIGVELHLESEAVAPLKSRLQQLSSGLHKYPHPFAFDPDWWHGRGALRWIAADTLPDQDLVQAMHDMIEATRTPLEQELRARSLLT